MIKNFFTLAVRNLLKRKLYSFINIFGLALGVAVCLVILRYVDFELSYDKYHVNASSVYRTTTTYIQNGENRGTNITSGFAQGPAMLADIPEVKTYIRTHPMYGGAVITAGEGNAEPKMFREENIQWVDSSFLDVFTYEAAAGNLSTALDDPNSIVITREMADKYFGPGTDVLGRTMKISGGWHDGDFVVTAVLKEVPDNSHFTFDFLLPLHHLIRSGQYIEDDGWGWSNFVTYVQLHENVDLRQLEPKLAALIEKYRGESLARSNATIKLQLQPILDIHLQPGLDLESSATISPGTIYFFLTISIFILGIAWVNYINLSTARAMERAREVGVKKAVGATRTQLIYQFVFESVLVNFLGIVIAVGIAIFLLPLLSDIVGKDLEFDFSDSRLWLVLGVLFVVGSAISGGYPAFVLSAFRTTEVLKGRPEKASDGFSLRKALVVFQFASSLVLIAGTFTIYRQVMFMRGHDKGLIMDQMLVFKGPSVIEGGDARARLFTLKNELKEIAGVEGVTTSGAIPGGGYNWGTSMRKDGTEREQNKRGSVVWVDPDFVDTYGIKVLAGRNFDPGIRTDMESVLVNEAALEAFNLGDPQQALQERIVLGGDTVNIVGVLKDYNWNSLKAAHSPWLLKADSISRSNFSVLLSGSSVNKTVRKVEEKFKEIFPGNPFDYYFLDDFFDMQYKDEQQFARIFSLFAILAILIACLGLFGLASFTTTLKLKEIGIRKVLGASSTSIMSLLSWQFLKLVLIACAIAVPLTWYGIDSWLGSFAFRIGLEWDLFVVPIIILSLISLATVSVQIFRGAQTNPARTLRSE